MFSVGKYNLLNSGAFSVPKIRKIDAIAKNNSDITTKYKVPLTV
jgi:hypothetical protein